VIRLGHRDLLFASEWGRAFALSGNPTHSQKGDHSWDSSFSNGRFRQQVACGRCFRSFGSARARFASACGSAKEVRAGLQLAVAYGYVPTTKVKEVDIVLDEVCAMSWRLSGR